MTQIIVPNGGPVAPDRFFLMDRTLEALAQAQGLPATAFLPARAASRVITVQEAKEADTISAQLGGRAKKPTREILLVGPDGKRPIFLIGAGVTEAAELEEEVHAIYEREAERQRAGHSYFDEVREREGLPPRDKVPDLVREALWERAQQHKRNQVTDPAPQRSQSLLRHYHQGASVAPKEQA